MFRSQNEANKRATQDNDDLLREGTLAYDLKKLFNRDDDYDVIFMARWKRNKSLEKIYAHKSILAARR